jgi:UDP-2,3-diacylglucosamine pyrophosphatase LpxH
MLVLISDLHLTDGSSGTTINAEAFSILRKQLSNLSYAASYRKDGTYKPVEQLDLVLLGDILDVIRSSKWLEAPGNVRPWTDVNDPAFVQTVEAISQAILDHNANAMDILKGLSRGQRVTVPATANQKKGQGEPELGPLIPVKVRIHYQVGNHDWFYHLPGSDFNRIRRAVVDAMGLANDPNVPFAFDPEESPDLTAAYRRHRVLARHGDVHDTFNFEGNRNASSLGDAIVVELLNRFPKAVEDRLKGILPTACTEGLREVDNVRPLPLIPVWVDGLLRRTCSDPTHITAVKAVWDDLVDDFLKVPFVRNRESLWNPFDNVHKLEYALKFSKGVSLGALSQLASWVEHRSQGAEGSYFRYALKEKAYGDRSAAYIVYGHTHYYEIVPLECSTSAGISPDQLYMNTGTWRRVYELAQGNPAKQEFVGYNVVTYISFFTDGERRGRPFETWSGSLAVT